MDRQLCLPKDWSTDADRWEAAGVPASVGFATKIVSARRMIDRAVAAGVPAKWVMADAVYGSDYHFRTTAEGHGLGYMVGVRSHFAVWSGFRQARVTALLAEVPADGWHRLRCGDGSKGPRVYDWAVRRTNSPDPAEYARWVRIRRSVSDPTKVAYFACGGLPATTVRELVLVAGARWAIEDLFELAKGDCGLDEHEVRSWTGWHRHIALSLLALAAVSVILSRMPLPQRKKRGDRLVRLSVPEVRTLLLRLVWAFVPPAERVLAWSVWRRRHQHRARECHYRKRGAEPPDDYLRL